MGKRLTHRMPDPVHRDTAVVRWGAAMQLPASPGTGTLHHACPYVRDCSHNARCLHPQRTSWARAKSERTADWWAAAIVSARRAAEPHELRRQHADAIQARSTSLSSQIKRRVGTWAEQGLGWDFGHQEVQAVIQTATGFQSPFAWVTASVLVCSVLLSGSCLFVADFQLQERGQNAMLVHSSWQQVSAVCDA
jgi:hypothetical protein